LAASEFFQRLVSVRASNIKPSIASAHRPAAAVSSLAKPISLLAFG